MFVACVFLQGDVVHTFKQQANMAKAFTGERVWFMKNNDIFAGTSTDKAFLHYNISGGEFRRIFNLIMTDYFRGSGGIWLLLSCSTEQCSTGEANHLY